MGDTCTRNSTTRKNKSEHMNIRLNKYLDSGGHVCDDLTNSFNTHRQFQFVAEVEHLKEKNASSRMAYYAIRCADCMSKNSHKTLNISQTLI